MKLYFPPPSAEVLATGHWSITVELEPPPPALDLTKYVPYRVAFHWNPRAEQWTFDWFSDSGDELVRGQAIVLGTDILRVHRYRAIPPGRVFASDSSGRGLEPGQADLFTRVVVGYETAA